MMNEEAIELSKEQAYIVMPDGTEHYIKLGKWIEPKGHHGPVNLEIDASKWEVNEIHSIHFPPLGEIDDVYINFPHSDPSVYLNKIYFDKDDYFSKVNILMPTLQYIHFPDEVGGVICSDIPKRHTIRLPYGIENSFICCNTAEFENIDAIHSPDFNGDIQMQEPIVER